MSFFRSKNTKITKSLPIINDYSFILKNIDISKLDKDYFTFEEISEYTSDIINRKVKKNIKDDFTVIDKVRLANFENEPIQTIIGKNKIFYYNTMRDIITQTPLPKTTKIPCAGCRRVFNSHPLGIPIKYHPSILITTILNQDGRKTEYRKNITIKERKELKEFKKIKNISHEIIEKEYYDTELIVCSFNCMYFVIWESPSHLYKETSMLIPMLYYDIFNKYPNQKILKSPSWKLRKEYGGPLSDEEFEKCLQKVEFTEIKQHSNIDELDLNENALKKIKPISKTIIAKEL
jgi:hypothetical protein